jgi:23S rRNA pseudouridine1911/1915/1917 synthase
LTDSEQTIHLIVPEECAGSRLDQAISIIMSEYSRSRIQNLIKSGHILVNGSPSSQKNKVLGGENISVDIPAVEVREDQAEPIPLTIVYEDENLLVVDKPAGLVVHPGAGNPRGTLMNALLYYDKALFALPRAGIVHRLDKDTSGLMVVARTEFARQYLIDAIKLRNVKRHYFAVVQGTLPRSGSVDEPVGRHHHNRLKMAVVSNGKPALSHYRLLEKLNGYSLCEVRLETGRTHQIRVHMSHLGFPLLGDPLYSGRAKMPAGLSEEARAMVLNFPRQALHAFKLEFSHPISHDTLSLDSKLPIDIEAVIHSLKMVT